jgi:hypothetical protein
MTLQDPHQIIDHLSPTDALAILRALAREDERLAARIAQIATAQLSDVDPGDVAIDLYEELNALEVEEVWDRSGSTRHGYVEPGEAADEMIDELLEPYLAELRKYHDMAMPAQANRLCMGLLLGLYRFERESTSKFKDWEPDAPIVYAEVVVDAWKEGSPSRADTQALRSFIEDELGGWGARLV